VPPGELTLCATPVLNSWNCAEAEAPKLTAKMDLPVSVTVAGGGGELGGQIFLAAPPS